MNADGSFTYTPDGGTPARETFTYQANNGTQSSNVARVEIRVGQTNHAPEAADDSYNVVRGGTLNPPAPGVLQNDTDSDGDALHAVVRTAPSHGTLTLNDDGSFTYVNDGLTTLDDTFTYVASDGIDVSREATVRIHVGTNNVPPQAVDDNYTVDEGATLNVPAPGVLGNDHDSDTAPAQLSAILVTPPQHGTLTLNGNGSFVYTHDGSETTSDSFTYRVSDRQASSNVATVHITINPVDDPPVAVNNSYTTLEDTTLTIAAPGVLGNDTDVDSPASSRTRISSARTRSRTARATESRSRPRPRSRSPSLRSTMLRRLRPAPRSRSSKTAARIRSRGLWRPAPARARHRISTSSPATTTTRCSACSRPSRRPAC
jgi:VCBS repeat-containing protein